MKPTEWTIADRRYVASGAVSIGYWLRCWQGTKLLSAVWCPTHKAPRRAMQETKR